ncbi:MAG: ATP-binding cassette domain-containing protein [Bacteriovoracaceae bacterium]
MNILKNKWFKFLFFWSAAVPLFFMLVGLGTSIYLGIQIPQKTAALYKSFAGDSETFKIASLSILVIFVIEYFNRVIYQISTDKYIQKLIDNARSSCYEKWMASLEAKNKKTSEPYTLGEILARIMSDTEALRELISSGAFSIFIDFSFIISCLFSFLSLNTQSGLAFMGLEIVVCGFLVYGSKYLAKLYVTIRKITSDLSRGMANITAGFSQTYYTPHSSYASKSTDAISEEFLKKQLVANNWETTYFSVADSLFPLFLCFLVIIFPYTQITEMAVIAALIDLIQRSIAPIKDVTNKISSMQRAYSGIERIESFLTELGETPTSDLNLKVQSIDFESLEVKVKNFSYPNKGDFSLQDVHFEGHRGQLLGIVGLSGSGKSTLLNLLSCNLFGPDLELLIKTKSGGKIHYSAMNPSALSLYRSCVGIVAQDSHIFSSTLEFNISMGLRTHEEFNHFYQEAMTAIPYLQTFAFKPQDQITPKDLSLGQKQLIMSLRAAYLKKTIVLFDEISSGLDSKLEEALRKMVLMISQNSLTIIVAHRIETTIQADKILVMDKGRLISSGTHAELLQNSDLYREFIQTLYAK